MGTDLNRIPNRRISNGQKTFKELFNIFSHEENANQNDSKIPSYTCQNGYDQKTLITPYAGEGVK